MLVDFRDGRLPDSWIVKAAGHSLGESGLHVREHFQAQVYLSDISQVRDSYIIRFELERKGWLAISDNTYNFLISFNRGFISGGYRLLDSMKPSYEHGNIPDAGWIATGRMPSGFGLASLCLEFSRFELKASLDGQTVVLLKKPVPSPVSSFYIFDFQNECVLKTCKDNDELKASGGRVKTVKPEKKPFSREIAVDFYDDLIASPYTADMFRRLFREFAKWGIQRCHWIDYRGRNHGWWDGVRLPVVRGNAAKTFENVGDFLKAAVNAAHENNIEIFGLLKPFDTGLNFSFGEGSEGAARIGRLARIGGPQAWIMKFPAERRDLMMSRKDGNFGTDRRSRITRIDIVKEDDEPCAFSAEDIMIYVSRDNVSYSPYGGTVGRSEIIEEHREWRHNTSGGSPSGMKRKARIMRLSGLDITEKYFAVAIDGNRKSFGNRFVDIIHVFEEERELRSLTYGMIPRNSKKGFKYSGVEFDYYWRGSAMHPRLNPMEERFLFDAEEAFIAVAAEKERTSLTSLSPSFRETRRWLLGWVEDILNAGADGVEIRTRSHVSPIADEYGFERPVAEAFIKRFGVDLNESGDFDISAWRKLRGEAYTQFLREAKGLAASRSKKFGLQISPAMDCSPEYGGAMNIFWDWKGWIKEGLPDIITLKKGWPGDAFSKEMAGEAAKAGIPVILSSQAAGRAAPEEFRKMVLSAREFGLDGFRIYECAGVFRAAADGRIEVISRPVMEAFTEASG